MYPVTNSGHVSVKSISLIVGSHSRGSYPQTPALNASARSGTKSDTAVDFWLFWLFWLFWQRESRFSSVTSVSVSSRPRVRSSSRRSWYRPTRYATRSSMELESAVESSVASSVTASQPFTSTAWKTSRVTPGSKRTFGPTSMTSTRLTPSIARWNREDDEVDDEVEVSVSSSSLLLRPASARSPSKTAAVSRGQVPSRLSAPTRSNRRVPSPSGPGGDDFAALDAR